MADIDDLKKKIEELEKQISKKDLLQNTILKDRKKTLDDIVDSLKDIEDSKDRINKAEEETNKFLNAQEEKVNNAAEKINNIKNNYNNIVDAEQILKEAEEDKLKLLEEQYKLNQKNYLLLLEQIEAEKDPARKEVFKAEARVLLERIKAQGKLLQDKKEEKEIEQKILNIKNEIIKAAQQYGSELEKHIIQLNTLNGGVQDYNGAIRESNRLMYAASVGTGLSIDELNKASQSLSKNMIGLSTQTAESVKEMGMAVAQLGKLGVDAATASKSFDSLVNSMGKTPQQAKNIQDSFIQMAAKNRLALGSVNEAFTQNSARFIGFGEQMNKVLQGLSEQALKTGIAIGNLVKIASGFDTFEDASRKVGNLNALLGGDYFNSIELLTATDEERIKLLKEGVAASGLQWSSMNRFQQMAIANAAGINDLNEAAKMFGETSLKNTRQQAEGAEVQKTLAEQAQSATLAMDKLKSSFNGLILILEPIITVLMIIVDKFSDFVQFINSGFGEIFGPKLGAIFTSLLLYGLYTAIRLRGAFGSLILTIGTGIVNAVKRAAAAIIGIPKPPSVASGPASAAVGPAGATSGFLANAGNMLRAAGAILSFAAALFVLAKALQEFSSDKINKEGIGLAVGSIVGLIGLSFLLQSAAPAITSGVFAIALIAGSLLLLGLALQMFSKVDWKLVAGIGVIIMGLGLAIVGLGMAVSGPQAVLLGIGIGIIVAIGVALTALGIALTMIVAAIRLAGPALTNLANSFKALFEIKDLKENFSNLESFLSQLSNIDVEPINNLANAIYNLATNLEALAAIPSKMGISVKGTADLKSVVDQTVANAAEATNVVSKATSAAATQTLIPAQQTTAFVPLVVQIDKKTIIEILDVEGIAQGVALDTLNKVGIVQSGLRVQDIIPQTTSP